MVLWWGGVFSEVQNLYSLRENKMTIPWTKCSEQMPPDDDSEILIRKAGCIDFIQTPANEIWYDINPEDVNGWEWAPYTPEVWAELNRK